MAQRLTDDQIADAANLAVKQGNGSIFTTGRTQCREPSSSITTWPELSTSVAARTPSSRAGARSPRDDPWSRSPDRSFPLSDRY
jgi:hypothetical protein